jgi:hypothetical protein
MILWYRVPLLGNDRKISSHTTAVSKCWLYKRLPLLGNERKTATRE